MATGAPLRIVRLSVNISDAVAQALTDTALRRGHTLTESIRRAVSLWKFASDEMAKGNRLMIVEGYGEDATYREVTEI